MHIKTLLATMAAMAATLGAGHATLAAQEYEPLRDTLTTTVATETATTSDDDPTAESAVETPVVGTPVVENTVVETPAKASRRTGKHTPDGRLILKDRFLPTSRRIDREVNRNKYVFKGETLLGLTASYGTFTSEDADMFPIFEDIDVKGTVATVNPFIGYFYRDNNCIGVRFGYTHLKGGLDNLGLDLGSNDLGLSIPQIDLASDRYSVGLFHRSYVSLDDRGRFGVFGEFEAMFSWGTNYFAFSAGETMKKTLSDNMNLKLTFSPGVAVYAFPNVCATLSFGLGGFAYNYVRQYDDSGAKTGERHFSKLNFRLNLADIRLGLNIHLWNNRKKNSKAE